MKFPIFEFKLFNYLPVFYENRILKEHIRFQFIFEINFTKAFTQFLKTPGTSLRNLWPWVLAVFGSTWACTSIMIPKIFTFIHLLAFQLYNFPLHDITFKRSEIPMGVFPYSYLLIETMQLIGLFQHPVPSEFFTSISDSPSYSNRRLQNLEQPRLSQISHSFISISQVVALLNSSISLVINVTEYRLLFQLMDCINWWAKCTCKSCWPH